VILPVISTMSAWSHTGTLVTMPLSSGSLSGDDTAPAERSAGAGRPRPDWQQVQTLRVADVVMTVLQARKKMPSAIAAAVSRAKHGDGYRVVVRLLDSSPRIGAEDPDDGVEGAVAIFVARELGADLAVAFDDKDVIILQ
jgi:hypothetical protein